MVRKNHSLPAAANTKTARNSRGDVGTKVGFVFIIKEKKKKLLRNLNKGREYFTLRE